LPVLKQLKSEGFQVVGLEQTDSSQNLHDYQFERKTALLIGHERNGIPEDQLAATDDCIEIPVYGLPYSYNVVTATTMAVYEYCRQFPRG
jgi:tRNA G18 (ribose-2'-O)-methylase SpoU